MMSFADVEAAVIARCHPPGEQPLAYLDALRRYLATDSIAHISDSALARIATQHRLSRDGYAEEVVSLIAGEQERRRQIEANKVLRWSQIGAWAAVAAALLASAALIK